MSNPILKNYKNYMRKFKMQNIHHKNFHSGAVILKFRITEFSPDSSYENIFFISSLFLFCKKGSFFYPAPLQSNSAGPGHPLTALIYYNEIMQRQNKIFLINLPQFIQTASEFGKQFHIFTLLSPFLFNDSLGSL